MPTKSKPTEKWTAAAACYEKTVSHFALYCDELASWSVDGFCRVDESPARTAQDIQLRLNKQTQNVILDVDSMDLTNRGRQDLGKYTIAAAAVPLKYVGTLSDNYKGYIRIKIYVAMLDSSKQYFQNAAGTTKQVVHSAICKTKLLGKFIYVTRDRIVIDDLPIERGIKDVDIDYDTWQTISFERKLPDTSETLNLADSSWAPATTATYAHVEDLSTSAATNCVPSEDLQHANKIHPYGSFLTHDDLDPPKWLRLSLNSLLPEYPTTRVTMWSGHEVSSMRSTQRTQ